MPVFEKRRFQHGAAGRDTFDEVFPAVEQSYRDLLAAEYCGG